MPGSIGRWVVRLAAAVWAALTGVDAAAAWRDRRRLVRRWDVVAGRRMHSRVGAPAAPPAAAGPGAAPVVCVHGFGVSGRYMVPTAARLAGELAVHVPDLPGFGRSERPPEVLDVPGMADALVAWMDVVGLERVVLLANSLGCQTAADLAARYPARVERMVLVAPTVEPGARTWWEQALRLLRVAARERPSLLPIQAADWLRFGLVRIWRLARHTIADRIEDKLPRVTAPTLVVRGGRDVVVPQAWAETVTRLLPHGRLVVIPDAGHAINYSAPEALLDVVRGFLGRGVRKEVVSA